MGPNPFTFSPVAYIRSPLNEKADAPRQGRAAASVEGRVEFVAGQGYEDALRDIDGFDYIWVISVFDRATGFRPTVLPPRSDRKRGVFATRAPRRPNPIGLSAVRLLGRDGLVLRVSELDLLDGTPVLDIKPYLAWADAIVDAGAGWLSRPADPGEQYRVRFDALALQQLEFLQSRGEQLRARIEDHLSIGPRPHAYRRIRAEGDGFTLAVRAWRVRFRIDEDLVQVSHLLSSVRPRAVAEGTADPLHREFVERFGFDGTSE